MPAGHIYRCCEKKCSDMALCWCGSWKCCQGLIALSSGPGRWTSASDCLESSKQHKLIFVVCVRVLTGILIGAERTITMYVLAVADALTVIQYGVVFCLLLDCNKCSVATESVTFLFIW